MLRAREPFGQAGARRLYTAAPDSEGTLGGLVSLGETANLQMHLDQALEGLEICSSDPLCAETQPERNMELGVLIRGGRVPTAIEQILDNLTECGEIQPIRR